MEISRQELKKYTSFRVGGKSDIFTPKSINELQQFLKVNTRKILFLGLGSNLLVGDKGFSGVIVHTKNLNFITITNNIIQVQSGTTLAKLSRFAKNNNQLGANFLSTIPGSVGGALAMNAGCFGQEIWNFVKSVQVIDKFGNIYTRFNSDFAISYREVIANKKEEYFISGDFKFDNQQIAQAVLKKRYDTQPIGTANCGSVFKNPPDNFAAQLIEDCNLKGFCIGDACVSKKHANFIVNIDKATSSDILKLIQHIQKKVKNKFKISLVTEVVII